MTTPDAQELQQRIQAALGFGILAATFAAEPETWPVFHAWAMQHGLNPGFSRDAALKLTDELQFGLSVGEAL